MSTGHGFVEPAARPSGSTSPAHGGLPGDVVALSTTLDRLGRDLRAWILLVGTSTDGRVLIDQAEDLRRRLRETGADARQLGDAARPPVPGGPDHGVVPLSPCVGALVSAATSLHAASHALGPAASALCRQDQLTTTLRTSGMVARRFLATAADATQDAARMITDHQTNDVGQEEGTPRLRLVHATDGNHRSNSPRAGPTGTAPDRTSPDTELRAVSCAAPAPGSALVVVEGAKFCYRDRATGQTSSPVGGGLAPDRPGCQESCRCCRRTTRSRVASSWAVVLR